MSSTVAIEVGLQTGVRSTGSRRNAANTRWRLVISRRTPPATGGSISFLSSFLRAGRDKCTAGGGHFLFPQGGSHIQAARQQQADQGIVLPGAGKAKTVRLAGDQIDFGEFPVSAGD